METKSRKTKTAFLLATSFLIGATAAQATEKRVCVEVVLQEISNPEESKQEEKNTPESEQESDILPLERIKTKPIKLFESVGSFLPLGQTPVLYLKRLFEHFITHEKGYIAVQDQCDERVRVELYPLAEGWTAFARYTGNGREERVDQLFPTELSQFAERAVIALLQDIPISGSINRDNVLKSDSRKSVQRIKGTNHFVVGLGTQLRGGQFDTAITKGDRSGQTEGSIRLFSPMTISAGYRGKFENWGIEAIAQLGIGTSKTAPFRNASGGHIDFGGDISIALHFLRYTNPRGLTSFYLGAGSTFELLWFSSIKAEEARWNDPRSTLFGGGLDVDLLFGWEFMRASSVQFFLQGELNLAAYVIDNEDDHGRIHTWFPCFSVKLGVVF